jgi:hypothetical protein
MQLYARYIQNHHPTCVSAMPLLRLVLCWTSQLLVAFMLIISFSPTPLSLLTWRPVGTEEESSEKHLVGFYYFFLSSYILIKDQFLVCVVCIFDGSL